MLCLGTSIKVFRALYPCSCKARQLSILCKAEVRGMSGSHNRHADSERPYERMRRPLERQQGSIAHISLP